ncbi:hypothetical protein HDU76_005518 [Blyttiomyces sp. JEL0837]|nr:hypothetical protein HDU76_005518 [Blyttiomyces sp. JEL0837]
MFLIGMGWLALGSIPLTFSTSPIMFIVFNALLGLAAAANLPPAMGSVASLYDTPRETNIALSTFGAASPIGYICGLFFGGLLSQTVGFRYIFVLRTVLSAITFVLGWTFIPRDIKAKNKESFKDLDYLGAFLVTTSLMMFIYAVTAGPTATSGWKTPEVLTTLLLSFMLMTLFILWERRNPTGILPMRLITKEFISITSTMVLTFFGFQIFTFFANLMLQQVFGLSPLDTLVHLLPMIFMGIVTAISAGYFFTKYPYPKLLMTGSLLLMMTSSCLFAIATETSSYWAILFPALALVTIGFDTLFNVTNILAMSATSPKDHATAAGLINTFLQISSGVAIAIGDMVASIVSNGDFSTNSSQSSYQSMASNSSFSSIYYSHGGLYYVDPSRVINSFQGNNNTMAAPATAGKGLESIVRGYHAAFWTAFGSLALAMVLAIFLIPFKWNASATMDSEVNIKEDSEGTVEIVLESGNGKGGDELITEVELVANGNDKK